MKNRKSKIISQLRSTRSKNSSTIQMHDSVRMTVGEMIREGYIVPLGLNITKLASALDVSPSTLSRLLNGTSDLTFDMAVRLSHVLGRSVESWMALQMPFSIKLARESVDLEQLVKLNG